MNNEKPNPYPKFFAMIATSTVVMMILMCLNTYALDHLVWSETRAYMAVMMGAAMAIVMLLFMRAMYPSNQANLAILGGATAVFALCLWLVRSQTTVGEVSWMKAMIPPITRSPSTPVSEPRLMIPG